MLRVSVTLVGVLLASGSDVLGGWGTARTAALPTETYVAGARPLCAVSAANWLLPGTGYEVTEEASLPQAAIPGRAPVQYWVTTSHTPGGISLLLSALASLGAYQGMRSLRRVPWSMAAAPDWYHTGARQVGYVTPLELDGVALSAWGEQLALLPEMPRQPAYPWSPCWRPQRIHATTAPRGPPC